MHLANESCIIDRARVVHRPELSQLCDQRFPALIDQRRGRQRRGGYGRHGAADLCCIDRIGESLERAGLSCPEDDAVLVASRFLASLTAATLRRRGLHFAEHRHGPRPISDHCPERRLPHLHSPDRCERDRLLAPRLVPDHAPADREHLPVEDRCPIRPFGFHGGRVSADAALRAVTAPNDRASGRTIRRAQRTEPGWEE